MTALTNPPICPPAASVEQMRDYFDKHVQAGRGGYHVEMRGFYWVMPPANDTHDDDEGKVFVGGFQ
jgi:hypothetical protein